MIEILKPTYYNIKKAAEKIKEGKLIVFPTETVYGLGADVFNKKAVARIFEVKERPKFDPLIVHISDLKQLRELIDDKIDEKVDRLIKNLWPGPLTIVFKKNKKVPDIVTSGLDTVAVRMPRNNISLNLIRFSKTPIAAPSANKFARTSPTKPKHILKQFKTEEIEYIIDGGKTDFGVESTIIKYENGDFYLLRKGAISKEDIEKIINQKLIYKKSDGIESPGQFKKHYAPLARVIIVDNDFKLKDDRNAGYIAFYKKPAKKFKLVRVLSSKKDLKEAAANLFDFFHEFEDRGIKKIYIEKVEEKGIGEAIMDRMRKASAG